MKYHLFKKNTKGEYTSKCGKKYDCVCVDSLSLLSDGWHRTLEEALKPVKRAKKNDNEG